MSTKRWRSSSLLKRLMPHAMLCSVWVAPFPRAPGPAAAPVSGGPNIISAGHHQRSTASWAIARCSSVPRASVQRISNPCRWWNDSSLQMRIIARAYGP